MYRSNTSACSWYSIALSMASQTGIWCNLPLFEAGTQALGLDADCGLYVCHRGPGGCHATTHTIYHEWRSWKSQLWYKTSIFTHAQLVGRAFYLCFYHYAICNTCITNHGMWRCSIEKLLLWNLGPKSNFNMENWISSMISTLKIEPRLCFQLGLFFNVTSAFYRQWNSTDIWTVSGIVFVIVTRDISWWTRYTSHKSSSLIARHMASKHPCEVFHKKAKSRYEKLILLKAIKNAQMCAARDISW